MSVSDGSASGNGLAPFPAGHPMILRELVASRTLSGNITLDAQSRNVQLLDPGGSHRDVTLPAEEEGRFFFIVNKADAAENLVIKDAAGNTELTINQNEAAWLWGDGTSWYYALHGSMALT